MLQKTTLFLITLCTFSLQSHIQFINTTNEHLFVIDIQLKKGYPVTPKQEIILLTSAQASHFLIYEGADDKTDNQKNQSPLFSFGTAERMQKHSVITLTTDDLAESNLPEDLFIMPSLIKRGQAATLIAKPVAGCSKCEERRKERERLAQQKQ